MNQFNQQGKREGYWEEYFSNGNVFHKGNYVNGGMDGYWEWYYENAKLNYKSYYIL
jgi:antitoxin component YwqK of YwqJK toxin-antitoxin module